MLRLGVMPKIILYSTESCGYCSAAKRFFQSKSLAFEEIDLTGDDEGREALRARSGRTSVPQIWIGDTHVGGYDDLRALERAGRLEGLLQG
jgi:glutaredoxin 3